jgi:hypothetical protein
VEFSRILIYYYYLIQTIYIMSTKEETVNNQPVEDAGADDKKGLSKAQKKKAKAKAKKDDDK